MPSDHPPRDSSSSSTREGWLRDFALLLRLRGVDGARMGDALAEVESYCDDSGQEPKEAFGEPVVTRLEARGTVIPDWRAVNGGPGRKYPRRGARRDE